MTSRPPGLRRFNAFAYWTPNGRRVNDRVQAIRWDFIDRARPGGAERGGKFSFLRISAEDINLCTWILMFRDFQHEMI